MDRAYYRSFIRTWTGGVSEACRFRVIDGSRRAPAIVGQDLIEVGSVWCAHQAVPVEALRDDDEPWGPSPSATRFHGGSSP